MDIMSLGKDLEQGLEDLRKVSPYFEDRAGHLFDNLESIKERVEQGNRGEIQRYYLLRSTILALAMDYVPKKTKVKYVQAMERDRELWRLNR